MVSPLVWKAKDPNRKGRGAGYYYKRYGYKQGHFSKYSTVRDSLIRAKKEKNLTKKYRHTADLNPSQKTAFKLNRKKFLGWL